MAIVMSNLCQHLWGSVMALPAESQTEEIVTQAATEWRWIGSFEELKKLKPDWLELESEIADGLAIFQTYKWCEIWTKCFIDKHQTGWQIEILTAWQDNKLVLLCPLAIKKHGPIRIAHWLGEPMTQYGTVLIAPNADQAQLLDDMWEHITTSSHFDIAKLNYIREDSALSPYLESHGDLLKEEEAVAHNLSNYRNLDDIADWYNNHVSRSSRRSRKRAYLNLREMGTPNLSKVAETSQIPDAINDVISFKAQWLEANGLRSSTFADPVVIDLLHELMAVDGSENLTSHFFRLELDSKAIAYDIGFESFGRYVVHIGAFHPDYNNCRPGIYLMEQSMAHLSKTGTEWLDLMAPAYEYKLKWATHITKIRAFGLPVNYRGKVYLKLYLERIRPGIKHILDNLPLPLKRFAKNLQDRLSR